MGNFTSMLRLAAGPVDAAYKAIDEIIHAGNNLVEFSIRAITEGIDALGEVTVRIEGTNGQSMLGPQTGTFQPTHLWRIWRGHRHHRGKHKSLSFRT